MNNKLNLAIILTILLTIVSLVLIHRDLQNDNVLYLSTTSSSSITVERESTDLYIISTYDSILDQIYTEEADSYKEAMEIVEFYQDKLEGLD